MSKKEIQIAQQKLVQCICTRQWKEKFNEEQENEFISYYFNEYNNNNRSKKSV